jgi:uncharacterized integral membrane protein
VFLRRFLWLLIALPSAALLVTLAVINRHAVRLVLDPFRPEAPVLSLELPFYAYLFAALLAGVLLGGVATWFSQGHYRKTSYSRTQDAMKWQAQADRLTRERDAMVSKSKQLTATR